MVVLVVVVNGNLDFAVAVRFLLGVVECSNVGVLQRALGGDALVRIKLQALREEVQRLLRSVLEALVQRCWLGAGEALKHGGCEGRVDRLDVVLGRTAGDLDDAVQLVHSARAREHGLAGQEFAKDAADRPDINTLGVLRGTKEDFWGSVPASGDVVGEDGVLHGLVLK